VPVRLFRLLRLLEVIGVLAGKGVLAAGVEGEELLSVATDSLAVIDDRWMSFSGCIARRRDLLP
jgi:hypothetical protein